jgi:hypothetical protein
MTKEAYYYCYGFNLKILEDAVFTKTQNYLRVLLLSHWKARLNILVKLYSPFDFYKCSEKKKILKNPVFKSTIFFLDVY